MKGAAAWLLIRITCGLTACVVTVVEPFDTKAACQEMVRSYDKRSDFCLTGSCGCQPGISESASKRLVVAF